MNIKDLKNIIKDLPEDTPVYIQVDKSAIIASKFSLSYSDKIKEKTPEGKSYFKEGFVINGICLS